jgi:hypothetical protein
MTGIEEMDNIVSGIKTISLRRAKSLHVFLKKTQMDKRLSDVSPHFIVFLTGFSTG